MTDSDSGGGQFESFWQDLHDDVSLTASEYREKGWTVEELSPGDVTANYESDKPFGLSVLVPNPEFERVEALTAECSFDTVEVYSRTVSSLVFLLIVERASESSTAIVIPAYYNYVLDSELLDAAADAGEMRIHVRALGTDRITFVHGEYSLFAPEPTAEDGPSTTE